MSGISVAQTRPGRAAAVLLTVWLFYSMIALLWFFDRDVNAVICHGVQSVF